MKTTPGRVGDAGREGQHPRLPTAAVHLVRRRGAGPHLAGVGPLSLNTSGQMSVCLTELLRQGAGREQAGALQR